MINNPKNEPSKNKVAEELVGLRKHGTPIQLPFEMDYSCPLCAPPINENTKIFTTKGDLKAPFSRLHFSEYNGFMWCEKCNIDIPSFLCLNPISKKAIEIYTERFLEFISEIRDRYIISLTPEEKDVVFLKVKINDLEQKIQSLQHELDMNNEIKKSLKNLNLIEKNEIKDSNISREKTDPKENDHGNQ